MFTNDWIEKTKIEIKNNINNNYKYQCIFGYNGCGKTLLSAYLASEFTENKKILFVDGENGNDYTIVKYYNKINHNGNINNLYLIKTYGDDMEVFYDNLDVNLEFDYIIMDNPYVRCDNYSISNSKKVIKNINDNLDKGYDFDNLSNAEKTLLIFNKIQKIIDKCNPFIIYFSPSCKINYKSKLFTTDSIKESLIDNKDINNSLEEYAYIDYIQKNKDDNLSYNILLSENNGEKDKVIEELKKEIETLQDKNNRITEQLKKYNDILYNILGNSKKFELFMTMSCKELTHQIIENINEISGNVEYEFYERLAIDDLTQTNWDKLNEVSKKCIISALLNYNHFKNIDEYDFSSVCISLSRAIEIELAERFVLKYEEYLISKNIELCYWPKELKNKKGDGPLDINYYTIGNTSYIMGQDVDKYNKEMQESYIDLFNNYCEDVLFNVSDKDYIKNKNKILSDEIKKVKDYRNKGAHKERIDYTVASECKDYILKTKQFFKRFLDEFRF